MAALLLLPGALAAQVAVGAGAGVTFSEFGGDDIDDEQFEGRTGFFVGGSVGIPLGGILGLGSGAYYVQKGDETADGYTDLAYLEIPLLLQVQATGPERPFGFSFFAGPGLGFQLSCDSPLGDCSDAIEDVDIGLLAGAGLSFGMGERATVAINGGLDLGLTSIVEEEDVKNRAYFLGLGVTWPVGG